MYRSTWTHLTDFIRRPQLTMVRLVSLAVILGLAEGAVLVGVVRIGLALAADETKIELLATQVPISHGLIAVASSAVAIVLLHVVQARLNASLAAEVLRRSRTQIVSAFLNASWTRQSAESQGRLQEAAMTYTSDASAAALTLANGTAAAVNLGALLLVALVVDWLSTLIVLLSGGVLFAALRPVGKATRRRARQHVRDNAQMADLVANASASAMEYRVFGNIDRIVDVIESANEAASRSRFRTRFARGVGTTMFHDLAVLFLVGSITALYMLDVAGIAAIGSVLLLVVRAMSSAQNVQSALQLLGEQSPSLQEIRARRDSFLSSAEPDGDLALDEIHNFEMREIHFSYDEGKPVLSNVSFRVGRGECIGLVGRSGTGKTTAIQLMLRLREPDSGQVLVNDLPAHRIRWADWTRLVSYVPQEPQLVPGSVADNIRFYRDGFSIEEVQAAAKEAQLDVGRVPLDQMVGPNGSGLSGGQRQRVAIARALLGRPNLLIMDEPTSALDAETERALVETVAELKQHMGILVVSHRPAILDVCDRLVQLPEVRRATSGERQIL